MAQAVLRFQPSLEQLALRLRNLVGEAAWDGQAQRVEHLLQRWGVGGAVAILGRGSDGQSQSALDLSVKACNYQVGKISEKKTTVGCICAITLW